MASSQIRCGDCICVSHAPDASGLIFARESEIEQAWGLGCQAA